MAFDFGMWSDGAFPLLFVCEEAHRYASADRSIGFGPTRKALSRIAKEGRKYGVFLGLVTQRPAELDSTIISQCSTLFAMRMANERDQAIVRSAVSDAAANLLAFVPSLGTREVLAFGEGVALPTRLKFKQLPEHLIPHSQAIINSSTDHTAAPSEDFIDTIIDRWRGATMSHKQTGLDNSGDFESLARDEFSALSVAPQAPSVTPPAPTSPQQPSLAPQPAAAPRLDPDLFKLLKRPIEGRSDVFGRGEPAAPPSWRTWSVSPEDQIGRCAAFAHRFRLVAGLGIAKPRLAPVIGALGRPNEIARAKEPGERPLGVVRPVSRKAKLATRRDHACERRHIFVRHETALPMPPLRPRIGIQQIDARERMRRQPGEQLDCIAVMQANVGEAEFIDRDQRLGHAVDEWLAADEAGARMRLRLRDQVLGAAKANLEPYTFDQRREQARKIIRCGRTEIKREARQQ